MKARTAEQPAQPDGATITSGLARQQRERERALKHLRLKTSAEIERLIDFMDASDPSAGNLADRLSPESAGSTLLLRADKPYLF